MPVLILTARDRWSEKVAGFDAGADDYLTKPYSPRELLLRIKKILARTQPEVEPPVTTTVSTPWKLKIEPRLVSKKAVHSSSVSLEPSYRYACVAVQSGMYA